MVQLGDIDTSDADIFAAGQAAPPPAAPAPPQTDPLPAATAVNGGAANAGAAAFVPPPPPPPPPPPTPLGISPPQYQAKELKYIDESGKLGGRINPRTGEMEFPSVDADKAEADAKIHADAAAEHQKQADDFQQFLRDNHAQFQVEHAQTQAAFDKWKAETKDEQDPSTRFWGKKSVAQNILGRFALVLGGIGGGLMKSGKNAVADQIQHEIDLSFQEHREHIKDLYEQQVAAGHIEDTSQNRANFEERAKVQWQALADRKIEDDLNYVADNSTSAKAKLLVKQTLLDVGKTTADTQNAYAVKLAAQQAAGAAQQRAAMKETRTTFEGIVKDLTSGANPMSEQEAEATALSRMGASRPASSLAPIATALGIPYDSETGTFNTNKIRLPGATVDSKTHTLTLPNDGSGTPPVEGAVLVDGDRDAKGNPTGTGGRWVKSDWNGGVPLINKPAPTASTGNGEVSPIDPATGRRRTPEQIKQETELIVPYNGEKRVARSKEGAADATRMISATDDLEKDIGHLRDLETKIAAGSGDIRERRQIIADYEATVARMGPEYNRAASGVNRATSQGEGEQLRGDEKDNFKGLFPSAPGSAIAYGKSADAVTGRASSASGKLDVLEDMIKSNRNSIENLLVPSSGSKKAATPAPAASAPPATSKPKYGDPQ